ncbi:MAG: acetate/propionate family kinase [Candidatus Pacebacteria bacterium]|nr:acetate/propionate family kinase [Candidatus Paceibacterota bacterium]
MTNKNLLVIFNAGSTSLKYKIFDYQTLELINSESFDIEEKGKEREIIQEALFNKIIETANTFGSIKAFGHRVVHGANEFIKPTIITKANIKKLEKYNDLAPLHNPYNLSFINLALKHQPQIKNIAVFDTGFFANINIESQHFAIPLKYFYANVKRYGFHGISHQYILSEASKILKKKEKDCNLIICHLGGGCSISAISKGIAIDISLGFTPLGGVMMSTRSGDIDPGVLIYLMKKYNYTVDELNNILNHQSGILGISNTKNYLNLLAGVKNKDEKCILAFNMFCYQIKKTIASYFGILNKVDAICFTGSIGSGFEITRKTIIKNFDLIKNIPILPIKTNEELNIARQLKTII